MADARCPAPMPRSSRAWRHCSRATAAGIRARSNWPVRWPLRSVRHCTPPPRRGCWSTSTGRSVIRNCSRRSRGTCRRAIGDEIVDRSLPAPSRRGRRRDRAAHRVGQARDPCRVAQLHARRSTARSGAPMSHGSTIRGAPARRLRARLDAAFAKLRARPASAAQLPVPRPRRRPHCAAAQASPGCGLRRASNSRSTSASSRGAGLPWDGLARRIARRVRSKPRTLDRRLATALTPDPCASCRRAAATTPARQIVEHLARALEPLLRQRVEVGVAFVEPALHRDLQAVPSHSTAGRSACPPRGC